MEAAAKMAAVAAEIASIAIKPIDMAAGMVKNAAETGIKAGMEASKQTAQPEQGRVRVM